MIYFIALVIIGIIYYKWPRWYCNNGKLHQWNYRSRSLTYQEKYCKHCNFTKIIDK